MAGLGGGRSVASAATGGLNPNSQLCFFLRMKAHGLVSVKSVSRNGGGGGASCAPHFLGSAEDSP